MKVAATRTSRVGVAAVEAGDDVEPSVLAHGLGAGWAILQPPVWDRVNFIDKQRSAQREREREGERERRRGDML